MQARRRRGEAGTCPPSAPLDLAHAGVPLPFGDSLVHAHVILSFLIPSFGSFPCFFPVLGSLTRVFPFGFPFGLFGFVVEGLRMFSQEGF